MITGDIKLSSNFEVNVAKPIDPRFSVQDIAERDSIVFKYPGLKVYVRTLETFYFWNGLAWAEFTGGASSPFLEETVSLPPNTFISGDNENTGLIVNINVSGQISVIINGVVTSITDDINGPFYFSVDGGLTATTNYLGSAFYWNASVAGYTLDFTDNIIFRG